MGKTNCSISSKTASVENYPREYLKQIKSGNEVVGKKIQAVYEREVEWMKNPPDDFAFYFDVEKGAEVITFIETFCRHSKGKWAGKPLKLELFQKAKFQLAFGWREKGTGNRRFREVVDIRGRKCGKSAETAAVELYELVADGEAGAEVYCTANKLDQSKLIFNEACNMRAQSPSIRNVTKKRQSDIYFPFTFSTLKALAADSKTMDGLNASFFSLDEFHEARSRKIYDVMKQSQAAREQPLAWLISTNGFVRELFFDDVYQYCTAVAEWRDGFHDYRVLPLIYELDSRDEWTDEAAWPKANPGLGKIKSLETLRENVEKAKRDPSFLPTLLTKDFNLAENTSERWLPYEACVNEAIEPDLKELYAIGGTDLSATTDLTATTLLIKKKGNDNFFVLQHFFLPEARVNQCEAMNSLEAPYRLWAEQGHLTICPGATVDFHAVSQWFVDRVNIDGLRPLWVCYDAALSGYWREEMEGFGFEMEKIRQGPFTWSYPMKELGGLLTDHKVIYQNNPITRLHLLNTGVKTLNKDGIQTIQPVKTAATLRIDGMVSLLNAYVGYKNHEADFNYYVQNKR